MPEPASDHPTPSILSIGLSNAAVTGGLTGLFGFVAASLTSHLNLDAAMDIAEATAGMAAFGFVIGIGSGIGVHSFDAVVRFVGCVRNHINRNNGPKL